MLDHKDGFRPRQNSSENPDLMLLMEVLLAFGVICVGLWLIL